jgi:hypothetical protein
MQSGPGDQYIWDMHVCHTWQHVEYPLGNVPRRGGAPSNIWDGPNPPPVRTPAPPPLWVP